MCVQCVCMCVPWCLSLRWSAMSEFGQKVNNYSAYSVIMVPVSPAAGEEGAPSRLSSSVMKYRHRGALYTWIFINTGLTVMRPEQVGWDTHIRVRSIHQEAVGETVKTSGRSSPCRSAAPQRAEAAHPLDPAHATKRQQWKQCLNDYYLHHGGYVYTAIFLSVCLQNYAKKLHKK